VMPDLASARAAVKRALADKPVTKIQNK